MTDKPTPAVITNLHSTCQHKRYRMLCDEFDLLILRSGGRCEICDIPGEDSPYGRLFIDHDAWLGWWAVRGLLCGTCNSKTGRGWRAPAVDRYLAQPWRTAEHRYFSYLDFRTIRHMTPDQVREHLRQLAKREPRPWARSHRRRDLIAGPSVRLFRWWARWRS